MTAPSHRAELVRCLNDAEDWMNADLGWKASLTVEERLTRRSQSLAEAQIHATLLLVDTVAELVSP